MKWTHKDLVASMDFSGRLGLGRRLQSSLGVAVDIRQARSNDFNVVSVPVATLRLFRPLMIHLNLINSIDLLPGMFLARLENPPPGNL